MKPNSSVFAFRTLTKTSRFLWNTDTSKLRYEWSEKYDDHTESRVSLVATEIAPHI